MIMATVLEVCIPGDSPLPAILENGVSRPGPIAEVACAGVPRNSEPSHALRAQE